MHEIKSLALATKGKVATIFLHMSSEPSGCQKLLLLAWGVNATMCKHLYIHMTGSRMGMAEAAETHRAPSSRSSMVGLQCAFLPMFPSISLLCFRRTSWQVSFQLETREPNGSERLMWVPKAHDPCSTTLCTAPI